MEEVRFEPMEFTRTAVSSSVMPKGVEHTREDVLRATAVSNSVMPKGVEHCGLLPI